MLVVREQLRAVQLLLLPFSESILSLQLAATVCLLVRLLARVRYKM